MRTFEIHLDVSDSATPVLSGLIAALEDAKGLHSAIAAEAEILTKDHIRSIAPGRHKTAERLGARPTGHLTTVADGVSSTGEEDAAVLSLGGDAGAFARAFGDVTITPRKGKYLTIPARAAAYGKPAGEFDLDLLFFARRGGDPTLALGKRGAKDSPAEVYYWLVRKATQPQDRGLLPGDDQYLAAAERGAIAYLESLPARAGTT